MKRAMIVFLAACGGSPKPAPAVSNETRAEPSAEPTSTDNARVVTRTASGGVIELSGDRDQAMADAEAAMAAHCGPNAYTIVQEGEEAIGVTTEPSPLPTAPDVPGPPTSMTGIAWRVHYQCSQ
jgi:hypothetical protein